MKHAKILIVLLAAMPILMITNCKKESAKASSMKFKLTDAPGAFDAVNIDIQGIKVYSEGQGWVTFNSDLGVVNILDYVNGQTTLMAEGSINAGTISAAQLIIGSNNSVVVNGVTYALHTPVELQSGLHLTMNNSLEAGGSYEWTIDFDAAQSIAISAAGNYVLAPTLHLIVDAASSASASASASASGNTSTSVAAIIGGSASGSGSGTVTIGGSSSGSSTVVVGDLAGNISGSLNSTIGLAIVTATDASGHATSTMTGLNGSFTLQAVQSGAATITIDPVLPLLSTKVISNVQVSAGQTTNIGLVTM